MQQPENARSWVSSSRNAFAGVSVTAALVLSVAAFVFAATLSNSPCANAQSTSCNVGDDETFTGPATFQDEINVGATPGPGTAGAVLVSQGADTATEWQTILAETEVKAADETVNDSASLQDDDDLVFTVEANATYAVEAVLLMSSGTAPDFKFDFSLPAGAVYDGNWLGELSVENFSEFSEAASEQISPEDSLEHPYHLTASLQTAGTAGTVTFRWAQQAATASDTKLHAGTWMKFRKME